MSSQPPTVFISYVHEDAAHKVLLLDQLKKLVRAKVISAWHDGLIKPGQRWSDEIVTRLKDARFVLLLVSPDFFESDYVNEVELMHAADRYAQKLTIIIPVLIRRVPGWDDQLFGGLRLSDIQTLPGGGKWVEDWGGEVTEAYKIAAAGLKRAVADAPPLPPEEEKIIGRKEWRVHIPDPPTGGVVPRECRWGDVVGHIVEEFKEGRSRLIMLSGPGGVGKSTVAAEAARRLRDYFGGRVVWSDAAGREDYTASSLFEDIAMKLGRPQPQPHSRPDDALEAEANGLINKWPKTLVVLDSYEVIARDERARIDGWFERSPCSALFVSHEITASLDLHTIAVECLRYEEASELLQWLVNETQSPKIFTNEVRHDILDTACGYPVALELIVGMIDETKLPEDVFKEVYEEMKRGEGPLADRVFNRSFNLPQLGDDGRDVLLALSLFRPNATHDALRHVAGFGRSRRDLKRYKEAVANLGRLWLLDADNEDCRLGLQSLRKFAPARLKKDRRAPHFKRRFVEYFDECVHTKDWPAKADLGVVEAERSNVVASMQYASDLKDWDTVLELFALTLNHVDTYRVWKRSILAAEREARHRLLRKGQELPLLIEINHRHEKRLRARANYHSIPKKLGVPGLASHADLVGFDPSVLTPEDSRLVMLSVVAFELGVCAHYRGNYPRSRDYFAAAKRLKARFEDFGGLALAGNNLAVTLAIEGLAGKGAKDWKARAAAELEEALDNFKKQQERRKRYDKLEKVAEINLKWVKGFEG